MARKKSVRPSKPAYDVFAGELDYTNVTEFRESLLPVVSDLEHNPTKRYLVTKHGKPLGVFMSFEAFEAVRRLVDTMLAEQDEKTPQEILTEASRRMDREHSVSSQTMEQLTTQLQAMRNDFQRMESMLAAYVTTSSETRNKVRAR